MRYAVVASAILGAVAAAPQMINIEGAEAVPTPTILGPELEATAPAAISYNAHVAVASVVAEVKAEGVNEKRAVEEEVPAACGTKLPGGAGPVPGDGSVEAYQELRANSLSASTPVGYTKSFEGLDGSSQQIGYLTYKDIVSGDYDVQTCADACSGQKYCLGFNIYYERDPKYDPAVGCANPKPVTNVKCSLYGYPVAGAAATNKGQWRGPEDANGKAFQVIIVGSNGYSKNDKDLPVIDKFQPGTKLPGAINAPLDGTYDTYNGFKLYNNNPYDPTLCAAACQAQTAYDKKHPAKDGSYKVCNFFTSYILTKNEVPLGTYCSLYTRSWDETYAVNKGYKNGANTYVVRNAASYSISNPEPVGQPKTAQL